MVQALPYGTWPSPISAADLATVGARHGDLAADGDRILWTEADPDTGAMRLHEWTPSGGTRAMATDVDVRSRVHEYGGGAIMAGHGRLLVVEFSTQDLYEVHDDGAATALVAQGEHVRWAAGAFLDRDRLVAVRETHDPDDDVAATVVNELVLLDLGSGDQHVVVTGHDFFGDPVVGSGGRLAWSTWEHPAMPWDTATLWAGRVDGTRLVDVVAVIDEPNVSLADWCWDGRDLVFTHDRSGFWEVARATRSEEVGPGGDPEIQQVTAAGIDFGSPRWTLGRHTLVAVDDTVVVVGVDRARPRLGRLHEGIWRPMTGDDTMVLAVVVAGDAIATFEVAADGGRSIRRRSVDHPGTGAETVHEVAPLTSRPGDLGDVLAVQADVDDGVVHGFLHLPANADVRAPAEELPPLLVFLHGGPTSHSLPSRGNQVAWWTTRGFAVVDLNYRGSAGYGREYREILRGNWGVTDVADCIAMARTLAADEMVDGERMAIRGGSAGGFTTLGVLTRPEHPFACGTSLYGVTDLRALAEHTHKFESRYLDSLVGSLPEDADVYASRSPLSHLDNLTVPVLVMHGVDDEVVPPDQSEAVIDAADERGIPHAHLVFEGEGHGFRKPSTIIAAHEAELAFYGEVMGFDPDGDLPTVLDGDAERLDVGADATGGVGHGDG